MRLDAHERRFHAELRPRQNAGETHRAAPGGRAEARSKAARRFSPA
jgi:hypothetical protein